MEFTAVVTKLGSKTIMVRSDLDGEALVFPCSLFGLPKDVRLGTGLSFGRLKWTFPLEWTESP